MRRGGGENLKDPECSAEVPEGCNQNRAYPQAPGTSQVDPGIRLRIVTQKNFPGTDAIGRKPSVRLQMDAKVRGGTTGSRPANDLISFPKGNCRAGGTRERLSLLGNDADARFKIEFAGVEIYVA